MMHGNISFFSSFRKWCTETLYEIKVNDSHLIYLRLPFSGMGTKLHGVHKLVISLMKNESYGIVRKGSKNHPEPWEIFQNIFPKTNFRIWFKHSRKDSMDRSHQQYNRELVRNTILKHEEIFRQQVNTNRRYILLRVYLKQWISYSKSE